MFIDKDISKRIQMLRFLMIFGVVMLHTPKYVPLVDVANTPFDLFKAFIQHAFFRSTVPVLSFISGYLLFSANLDQKPFKLWSKKFKSLAIPFAVFNFSLLGIAYVAQTKWHLVMNYNLVHTSAHVWLNAAFGLADNPINYPLNFVRDMFVLMIIAPVFGYFIRTMPVIGTVFIMYFFLSNYDGGLILRNQMAIQFYVGGLLAVYKINMRMLDKHAKSFAVLFLAVCVTMIAFRITDRTYFTLFAPIFIWAIASLLVNTKFGTWAAKQAKYSFFIFVAHAPVLIASSVLYEGFGKHLHIPYAVYWFTTPFLTAAFLIAVYRSAFSIAPTVFSFMLGARATEVPVFVERRQSVRPQGSAVYSQSYRELLLSLEAAI